jgi:exosome complex RNA-binding protein Rrp42 (RNase PH superfamily)
MGSTQRTIDQPRCYTCEKGLAVAKVEISPLAADKRQRGDYGHGLVCRRCLRGVCRAMGLDYPLDDAAGLPDIFEDIEP